MYATFSADLESSSLLEATQNRDFEKLIATKTEQLEEAKAERAKKEREKAAAHCPRNRRCHNADCIDQ